MTLILPTDTSDGVERLASLDRRIADLEARSRSSETWRGWFRSLIRWLATTPPLLVVLVVAMEALVGSDGAFFGPPLDCPMGVGRSALGRGCGAGRRRQEIPAHATDSHRCDIRRYIQFLEVAVLQPYRAEQSCLWQASRG